MGERADNYYVMTRQSNSLEMTTITPSII